MQRHVPQFFDFFFIREHFQRFLTRIEDRYEPVWFFIPVLAAGCLPWILPAARAFGSAWRSVSAQADFEPRAFLWVWVVVVFVFFLDLGFEAHSVHSAAFPGARPPDGERSGGYTAARSQPHFGTGLIAAGVLLWRRRRSCRSSCTIRRAPPISDSCACRSSLMGLVAAGGGWIARGRRDRRGALGITAYLVLRHSSGGRSRVAPLYSGASLAAQISHTITPGTKLYAVRTYDQTLPFYLSAYHDAGRLSRRARLRAGLGAGQRHRPTLPAFATRWMAEPEALAVMEPDTYALLRAQGLPMVVRASDPNRLIVSRR
jgi:hypothetical protein